MSTSQSVYVSGILRLIGVCLVSLILVTPIHAQKKKKSKREADKPKVEQSEENLTQISNNFIEGEKFFLLKNYSKSAEHFEKVLKLDDQNAAAHYKLAEIYSETQEYTKALPYAIRAKQIDPKNKYYYLILANLYTNLADLEMAASTYYDLVTNVDGTENYLFDLAALQLYQKKYDAALETYNRAQQHFGLMDEIVFQKQKIFLKQNKLDLAVDAGEQLIRKNPGKSNYVASLAQILISNNQSDQARTYLEEYVNEYGDEPTIGVQLAEIYRKAGKVREAILILKAAFESAKMDLGAKISTLSGYMAMLPNDELVEPLISLTESLVDTHPDSFQGYAVAGDLYYNTGRKEQAIENYLKAIDIDASNFNVWQNIISIEMDLQNYQSAISHTEKALELFPNQGSLYYFGGTAYMIEKDYHQAINLFNAGKVYTASNKNLSSVINGQLGDAYNSVGDNPKSDAAYEEALRLNPDNDHVLNNYSYFLSIRKENLAKAEEMSTKLITLRGNNPTYQDTHGWVLYVRKKYKEALKYLQMAAEQEDNPTIIEHYGDVLFQLGQVEDALKQWIKARDLSDNKEDLNKKIEDKKLYE